MNSILLTLRYDEVVVDMWLTVVMALCKLPNPL